jgi:hypothetical protein
MSHETDAAASSLSSERTYRNLRVVMIGALLTLAVSVGYQTAKQHAFLSSISAYYYTPALAIFVGALIGLGLAMIALRGTNDVEDVLLNLAGIAAPVIALVPTSRGADFESAVKACATARGNYPGPKTFSCDNIRTLVASNRANVQNNMFAYLAAGLVALVFVGYLVYRESRAGGAGGAPPRVRIRWSFGIAAAAWLVGVIAYFRDLNWLIAKAHYSAATSLFVLILGVVVANAFRRSEVEGTRESHWWVRLGKGFAPAFRGGGRWYGYYAIAMLVVTAAVALLWKFGPVSLFWVEATVICFFAVFWILQTREQWGDALDRWTATDAAVTPVAAEAPVADPTPTS